LVRSTLLTTRVKKKTTNSELTIFDPKNFRREMKDNKIEVAIFVGDSLITILKFDMMQYFLELKMCFSRLKSCFKF